MPNPNNHPKQLSIDRIPETVAYDTPGNVLLTLKIRHGRVRAGLVTSVVR
ncbi:hypothetical protein MC7420_1301 [Coleofasciculus chthonoplastes PCC 7420]|uniref:Uncharacterized protein n=1 Tax=Coleofasciculus chthonoplastes PCC 7420 TaxID=118168 RepID=B4VRM9_9CYAN|nr:hypothetical protein MC7420_1301 [Coleofasciculus chthonoplastes PCC 7420]